MHVTDCSLPISGVSATASPVTVIDSLGIEHRYVEIFWWGLSGSDQDWLGVWSHNPEEDTSDPIDVLPYTLVEDGHSVFAAEFNSSEIPDDLTSVSDSMCLSLWVGYVKDDILLYSDCLKIHPHWMRDMRDEGYLLTSPLVEILLPGTHDAGAAVIYKNWTADDGFIEETVSEWTFTHHNGLYNQLVLGARYLDMRIEYYPEKEHVYYINHHDVPICPLYIGLEEVAKFMSQTEEIVVFDIHSLERNFKNNEQALKGLMSFIESYFVNWMVPSDLQPNPTLKTIWELNDKRLIVTLPVNTTSNLYWTMVHHLWPNVNKLDDLISFFDDELPNQANNGYMWSMMAEFTASAMDVTLNHWGGLSGAANVSNFPVTTKLREEWWTEANIVAMDFIQGSAVIDTILQANQLKYLCSPNSVTN